jgi:hypothetical protein
VFVLVVEVTKVRILSTLFSPKEEQDHKREKEAAPASLSSLFSFLKLNPRRPTLGIWRERERESKVSASLFAAAGYEPAPSPMIALAASGAKIFVSWINA